MTRERAIRLAEKWSDGHVCTLREGEAQEYSEIFYRCAEEFPASYAEARVSSGVFGAYIYQSGEVVLDNCMGSGSTGVACAEIGRKFIGMELNDNYFQIAKNRIEEAYRRVGEGEKE